MIKVLVVDDSALVRKILSEGLSKDPMIKVVGAAVDPYQARDMIIKLRPDVMTLDVEMPKMDGVEFLKKLMPQFPIPTIMVSSLTQRGAKITLDALEAGAVDLVAKPKADVKDGLNSLLVDLILKVKAASLVDVSNWKNKRKDLMANFSTLKSELLQTTDRFIAIGASTGGTEALRKIICCLPKTSPGIVVVQHMPKGFTKMFAERLNEDSQMSVIEASDGDEIKTGKVLIAPGDFHLRVIRSGGRYIVKTDQGEKVCRHRPSVDVLFRSVAENVGQNVLGIMLTGMGRDGADAMKLMKDKGAYNLVQDEASSVIFGMPKEAIEVNAHTQILSLDKIASRIVEIFKEEKWPRL